MCEESSAFCMQEVVSFLHNLTDMHQKHLARFGLCMSCSTPCLAMVIPAVDRIDETLTNNSPDPAFEPSIHTALGIAKKTLNWYYNATDQSEVYRIAMGISPIV
jgi:hypothetical protein